MRQKPIFSPAIALVGGAMWAVSISAHELIGHGGVCAVDPNCTWVYADAMYFHGDFKEGAWETAWRAAGSIVNLIFGTIAAFILAKRPPLRLLRYFALFQLMAISFFQSGSYIAFGWAIDPGMDWALIVAHGSDPGLARIVALIGGGGIILFGLFLCARFLPQQNRGRDIISSYVGFVIVALAAAAFVPTENRLYMLMGGLGSSALFMSWLLFLLLPIAKGGSCTSLSRDQPVVPGVLSILIIAAYVFLLGRGIRF